MNIPGSLPEILIFAALVVPGVSFSLAKRSVVGWQSPDHSAASRLLEALYASVVFFAVYAVVTLAILGWTGQAALDRLLEAWDTWPGWVLAATLVGVLVVIPAAFGYLSSARFKRVDQVVDGKTQRRVIQTNRARSTPRAWDHAAFRASEPCWVRVRKEDGRYYGGWFDTNSLVSTYPFDRDIFIAVAWNMGEHGEFECEQENTRGIWVPITDGSVIEWLNNPSAQEETEK